jgi:hypothetical protein
MSRGVVAAMARAYRDPRGAMAEQVARGLSEPQALVHLFLACFLGLVASLPQALRQARSLDTADPVTAAVTAHLFGYVFVAPLLAYGLAALVHLAARAFGARGAFLPARAATFWALLLAGPIAITIALAGAGAEIAGLPRLPWLPLLGYAGLAWWLWLFAATLAEAEGFRTGRVAAALVLVAAGLALVLGAMARAG